MKTSRRNAIKLGAAAAVASVIPMTANAAPDGDPEAAALFNACVKANAAHAKAAHGVVRLNHTDAE